MFLSLYRNLTMFERQLAALTRESDVPARRMVETSKAKALESLRTAMGRAVGALPSLARVILYRVEENGDVEEVNRIFAGVLYSFKMEDALVKIVILNPVVDGVQTINVLESLIPRPGGKVIGEIQMTAGQRDFVERVVAEYEKRAAIVSA